jgi:hypothetical protein
MIKWSNFFRSDRARILPVLLQDVSAEKPPNPEIERQRNILGLRLIRDVVVGAEISGKLRDRVASQVAARVQGGF